MLAFKDQGVKGNVDGVAFLLRKHKIDHFHGTGRIAAPDKVEVTFINGEKQAVEAKAIVIATGSEVANVPGIAIDEKRIVSSTGALSLPQVPKRMVVIGAGYIGLELGSVWSRLGAEVTVVEMLDRVAPGLDGEVAKQLQRVLAKQGLAFKLGTKVTAIDSKGKSLKLTLEPAKGGKIETLECDVVLVAVGRVPNTQGLGLGDVGVKTDNRGRVRCPASSPTRSSSGPISRR
jgi:dihydrolipoamide dehydrogenase